MFIKLLDAGRFGLAYFARTTPVKDSLYTFPSITLGTWLGIALRLARVSPNSPRFSIQIPLESCVYATGSCSTIELHRNILTTNWPVKIIHAYTVVANLTPGVLLI